MHANFIRPTLTIILISMVALNLAAASSILNPAGQISLVQVAPESGNRNIYQLAIQLTSPAQDLSDWRFGFFMFYLFQKPNPELTMEVCQNSPLECRSLIAESQIIPHTLAEVNQADLSSGHLILFKSNQSMTLLKKHSYTFRFKGLRNIPQNLSLMPQGFFFIESSAQVITPLVEQYRQANYNESALVADQQREIRARWREAGMPARSSSPITPIIPLPQQVSYRGGWFQLESKIAINNQFSAGVQSENFIRPLQKSLIHDLKVTVVKKAARQINLYPCQKDTASCKQLKDNPEGYVLEIAANQINIYAFSNAGILYAAQTLAQLFFHYHAKVPSQTILDYPKYPYRGIMLDSSRHFFNVAQIKLLLDVMASQKLNTLHLHLADDEGWRIALKQYPDLTRIASQRYQGYPIGPSNLVDGMHDVANPTGSRYADAASHYAGYYSLQNIRDLISYANSNAITIIPEIEMPGHARALKKALAPALYDFTKPTSYLSVQGYNDNVLPVYLYQKNSLFTETINGITNALANLFSGQRSAHAIDQEISLSADEVPRGAYPGGLDSSEISHHFFYKLSKELSANKISGYQQLVQNDDGSIAKTVVAPDQVGHLWVWLPTSAPANGLLMAQQLLQRGYPVVADFADYAYLDIRASRLFNEPGLYWSTDTLDTWKTFSLGKAVQGLNKYPNFNGVEGALWSELIGGDEHLWYMLLPKMTGIAEAGWSNPNQDSWLDFSRRLGCGKIGFLAYLSAAYSLRYRGYPNGIQAEIPVGVCQTFISN